MAIDVLLQNERGETLDAVGYPLDSPGERLYPDFEDPAFPLLGLLDLYEDTVFSTPQMEPFLTEWQRLYAKAQTAGEQEFLRRVERLALRCQNDVHLYLKFFGD